MNAGTFLFYMKLIGIALIVGGVIGWIVELLRRRALDRERDELTAQLEEAQQEIERLREFEDELYIGAASRGADPAPPTASQPVEARAPSFSSLFQGIGSFVQSQRR
jgi:hypothetical protein